MGAELGCRGRVWALCDQVTILGRLSLTPPTCWAMTFQGSASASGGCPGRLAAQG